MNSQGRGGGMRGGGGSHHHRGGMGPSMHSRGGGGGRHGGGGPQGPQPTLDKPKREAILDLAKYVNARIRVKFTGGREGVCAHHIRLLVLRHNLTAPKKK